MTFGRGMAATAATCLAVVAAVAGARWAMAKMRHLAEYGGDDGA